MVDWWAPKPGVVKRKILSPRQESSSRTLMVVPCAFLTDHHAMKAYWGMEV